jgi:DNA-binding SARP family transcriptional activator
MPNLSIRLFGYPQFQLDGSPIKVERRKTLALAAYLAVESPQRETSRERIATLFWPDCFQDQAGAYLRQALWDFSKAAGDSWIAREEQTLLFQQNSNLWVDVNAFSAGLAKWKSVEPLGTAAISLLSELVGFYKGDFMAGFNLRDCPVFDEWQVYHAETYRLQLGQALEALVKAHVAGKSYDQAVECARRWLALDPLNEAAHLALMQLYADQGQRSPALLQYETLTRILADELGVEPGAETTALFERIRDAAVMPGPAAAASRPVRLPAQLTAFVGREEELARIETQLLEPDCRLISLVGVGGSGKTRLSIQAAGLSQDFPDGVFFVGLAAVNSFEQLLTAIADALKMNFHTEARTNLKLEAAKIQLLNHLAARKILLVLDNFEQLSSCSDFLAALLDSAPMLKIIVTSRERLNLHGETVIEVGGLATPDDLELFQVDAFAAVQLFIKSAYRTGRFHPTESDWPQIVRICRMVEGIPLGLEMAAGWTRTVTCAEIAAEIDMIWIFCRPAGEACRRGSAHFGRSLNIPGGCCPQKIAVHFAVSPFSREVLAAQPPSKLPVRLWPI